MFGLLTLPFVLLACTDPVSFAQNKLAARAGLDSALAELPKPGEFEMIKVIRSEFDRTVSQTGETCYLARGYVIYGSTLQDEQSLDALYRQVQILGWVPRKEQDKVSRVLGRGPAELMEIEIYGPGEDLREAAKALVKKSLENLIRQGVTRPSNIPWNP